MAITKAQFPNFSLNVTAEVYTDSIDLVSVAANISATQEVTASTTGLLKVGDLVVLLDDGGINAGLMAVCLPVATIDKFNFRVQNSTAGALDPTAKTMKFLVIHVGTLN